VDAEGALARAPGVVPAAVPASVRYRVALSPAQVLERLAAVPEIAPYRPGRFPDLGDPVPARAFVAELGEHRLRVATTGARPGRTSGVSASRGFGEGGGMLPTLELVGTLLETAGTTQVDLRLVRRRSARGAHRWAGFVVVVAAGLAWLALGSGALVQRAVVLGIAAACMSPAVILDAARALRERRERLELLALMERVLGPVALDDAEHSPYRNPRGAAELGSTRRDEG